MELMNGVLLNLADRLVAELDLLGPTSSSIGDGLSPVTSPLRENGPGNGTAYRAALLPVIGGRDIVVSNPESGGLPRAGQKGQKFQMHVSQMSPTTDVRV